LCTVNPPSGCEETRGMEECRPDPDPFTNRGVCLKKSSDPAARKQLDELTKKGGGIGGGTTYGVKEGEGKFKNNN